MEHTESKTHSKERRAPRQARGTTANTAKGKMGEQTCEQLLALHISRIDFHPGWKSDGGCVFENRASKNKSRQNAQHMARRHKPKAKTSPLQICSLLDISVWIRSLDTK